MEYGVKRLELNYRDWIQSLKICDNRINSSKCEMLKYLRSRPKGTDTAGLFLQEFEQAHNVQFTVETHSDCKQKLNNLKSWYHKHLENKSYNSKYVSVEGDIVLAVKLVLKHQRDQHPAPDFMKPYEEASDRTKRRRNSEVSKAVTKIPIKDAIIGVVRRSGILQKSELIKVLDFCLYTPGKPKKVLERINKDCVRPYSEMEALALVFDINLTQANYVKLRLEAKERGAEIYPPYRKLQEHKEKLHPSLACLELSETRAKFPLQELLDHTVGRIVEMQDEVLKEVLNFNPNLQFTCFFSWGFDGSTGQSNYKQKYSNTSIGPNAGSSLFATSIIPVMIVQVEFEIRSHVRSVSYLRRNFLGTTYNDRILWINTVPQSTKFCRPLELDFVKESKDVILSKQQAVEDEINELMQFQVTANSKEVIFSYHLAMTIIDGKVLNYITGTNAMQRCPICQMKPKSFNNLDNIKNGKFTPKVSALQHGMSPLHAYIRLFELAVHIAYKKGIMKWQARGSDKTKVETEKRRIQTELFEKMSILVDFPKPGGSGSSNDGNTARRAFADCDLFCEILGIDKDLIIRFRAILISITLSFPIDVEKFGEYCLRTAEHYVAKYPWYHMSQTLHRILVHGKDIIASSMLPVGMYSEQAGESRNKIYKHDRSHNSRQCNRTKTLKDTFLRSVDSSDPIVATEILSKYQRSSKREKLPLEVMQLLHVPVATAGSSRPATIPRFLDYDESLEELEEILIENSDLFEGSLQDEEMYVDDYEDPEEV